MSQQKKNYNADQMIEELSKMDAQIIHGSDVFKQAANMIVFYKQECEQILEGLRVCKEALSKLKPETECPFCLENEPCGHCMEMARVAGQVARALSHPAVKGLKEGK